MLLWASSKFQHSQFPNIGQLRAHTSTTATCRAGAIPLRQLSKNETEVMIQSPCRVLPGGAISLVDRCSQPHKPRNIFACQHDKYFKAVAERMPKKQTFVCVIHDAFWTDACPLLYYTTKFPSSIYSGVRSGGADLAGPRDQKTNQKTLRELTMCLQRERTMQQGFIQFILVNPNCN